MNNTFTREESVHNSPKPTLDVPDCESPIARPPDASFLTSTPNLKPQSQTVVMSVEETNGNENKHEKELAGCNLMDVIIAKHTTKHLTEIVRRLLESDEFEVRRCSDGTILSQGRLSNFGLGGNGGNTVADEEYQRAIRERDQARQEAEKMHENYATLYNSFNTVREAANEIRGEYEDAAEKLKMAAAEVEEWKAKFIAVKENANEELERASQEYDDLVKNHEENTKNLRLRAKRLDIEVSSKNDEIEILKNRVVELSQICDQLMNDVEVYDSESRHSAYDA